MPRMQRLTIPGAMVHIMNRGIDGKKIFNEEDDKREFIRRFSKHLNETGFLCYAWCLMDNHYHFLLRINDNPMSKLMRPLNGGYARWFNHKYDRRGYLFQDRYKSVLCQDQEYARQLIRYIHLNPVRGGKVLNSVELANWEWCGHGYLTGRRNGVCNKFQDRNEALRRFGKNPESACKKYLDFIKEGLQTDIPDKAGIIDENTLTEIKGSERGWPAVVGNPEFAKKAMKNHEISSIRIHRKADYNNVLLKLHTHVCSFFKLNKHALLLRSRENNRSKARSVFCFKAYYEELLPKNVIAKYLNISISAVSKHLKKDLKI